MQHSIRKITRIALIAAMYAAVTFAFMAISYGPIQFRIAEALTLLPLLFPESIIGLTIGCMLANIASPFGILDILLGGAATGIAAVCTFLIGKYVKRELLRVILAGLPPILINAFVLPAVWLAVGMDVAYWSSALSILATQALFVYAAGVPLYLALKKVRLTSGKL